MYSSLELLIYCNADTQNGHNMAAAYKVKAMESLKMSRCQGPDASTVIIEVYEILRELGSRLAIEWVCTADQEADDPSRYVSPHDDSILSPHIAKAITSNFDIDVDCYA